MNCNLYPYPSQCTRQWNSSCACSKCVGNLVYPDYTNLGCIATQTECIIYNGVPLQGIPLSSNQALNTVLANIDAKLVDVYTHLPLTKKVSVTSAEILQLFTTPKILIAAPGDGKVIVPHRVLINYKFGTIAYTTNTNLVFTTGTLTASTVTSAISYADNRYTNNTLTTSPMISVPSTATNVPITLSVATGNPAAGDGTLDLYITYSVITL